MDWTSPYVDHKVWILDHLESLHLEPKEALVLLLIDYYNDMHKTIHHEMIAQKLHIDVEVETLFHAVVQPLRSDADLVHETGKMPPRREEERTVSVHERVRRFLQLVENAVFRRHGAPPFNNDI